MKWIKNIIALSLTAALCGVAYAGEGRVVVSTAPAPRPSAAAVALFVNSNLDSARTLAASTLRRNSGDVDSLFVQMEAAALQADTAGELEAALRLCESAPANDQRVSIAAARILDHAGNTTQFRAVIPRIQRLISANAPQTNFLRAALVAAASEGAPGLSTLELARRSGLLTDWRIAGPFGNYANVAFDRSFAPERDNLVESRYDDHAVENFRFDDGNVTLADYFSQAGVSYAASQVAIPTTGEYRLRIESAGTLETFVDGMSVLRKDDRFHATPEIVWSPLRLSAGTHRLLVKFIPSAAPFRVAVLPAHSQVAGQTAASAGSATGVAIAEPEASYVKAAERFWMGNYDGAIAQLTAMRKSGTSAAVDYMLAEAWSHNADDSPEEAALLESALKQAPLALAAEYALSARAYNEEHLDEAFTRARRVTSARPDYVPAQHMLALSAMRLNWNAEAGQAFNAELQLRPVCSVLRSASKFFSSIAAFDRAEQIERELNGCAPGSLAYAEALSEAGRHTEAAAAMQQVIAERPLDREARALLARELASAGQVVQARRAAEDLVAIAPNATRFRSLADQVANGVAVLDAASQRGRDFASARQFYTAHRRDGIEFIHKTANRRFAGGPAVVLLYDRVAKLNADGSVAVYIHKVTRVLNRDGIEKYGEVNVPRTAELLELRTIKQDDSIVEPEFNQHKTTVSMPALAPGDAIEQEYVVRYADGGVSGNQDAFSYTFGSFVAPILYARFVVLSPQKDDALQVVSSNVAAPVVNVSDGTVTRVWEQENILQTTEEVSAPRTGTLPNVRVIAARTGGWQDVRDFYRNELIESVRVGTRVESTAREQRGTTQEETTRNLYRFVTTRLRSSDNEFASGDLASAESTLANYAGSRTTALLAMARAEGIDAELLLARDIARPKPTAVEVDAYAHPVVRFRFGGNEVLADAESDGLAFGVLPPGIAKEDAVAVPLAESVAQTAQVIVPLPAAGGDEHSVADGDVTFDTDGNLNARMTIRMGASRSAQMRSILSGVQPGERRHFFEQLAQRIFTGAADADGEVHNERDAELPLELVLSCRAPHFLNLTGDTTDMEQLAPALGLRKMYGVGTRKLPLYIDTPLIETTTLRVHLPAAVRVVGQATDLRLENEFGAYTVEFRQLAEDEVEVKRAFRIPVQVIAPERFDAFSRFARQIDDAERQRVTLGRLHPVTTARSKGGD